ncbi:hypothetical protein L1889_00725 [Paenalcaligenes niemegkensis]|uniref:hypothetical protein n=1 Tax=Paenalcaligenes niemegkensis TaxID=2895469 RepID=UPI001EE783A1|nr:hypothetical protein [Paenalcaligenes niemegkensis]MCQ9615425.1 hypothetical protein [Paenalcaligenes niemegkensis]
MIFHRNVNSALKWALLTGIFLTGCAQKQSPISQVEHEPAALKACEPAAPDDQLVGNWLSKRQEKGVAGELRTLFTLQATGQMAYTEQLKRPRQPSQGLMETGCWWREGDVLVLETRESNGLEVDTLDPLFTNRFTVKRQQGEKLTLSSPSGADYNLTRTSPGYRLPF